MKDRKALKISAAYAIVSGGWIAFSDSLVHALARDPAKLTYLQNLKGWGFVLVTALLLYAVIQRSLDRNLTHAAAVRNSEERERHLNRVLRGIRNVNQLIIREKDRQKLIGAACDALVDTLGYHSAWIVLFAPIKTEQLPQVGESGPIRSIHASAEKNVGGVFSDFIGRLEKGERFPCVEKVLRREEPIIVSNPSLGCPTCPIHLQADQQRALTACLAHDGTVYGLLCVTLPDNFSDDPEEREILREMAEDFGFALHDIALGERHRAAGRAVTRAKEHLELITDNLPLIISHVDADQRYVFVNHDYEICFQVSKSEIIGRRIVEILGEDYYQRVAGHVRKALAGIPAHFEETLHYPNGKTRNAVVSYIPCPPIEEKASGFFVLGQDITERVASEHERRRLQQQLMQTQKMEALGALAGGIAHDFNNMLAAMIGFTELSQLDAPPEHALHHNLQEVLVAGHRAKELVRQILTFSRQSERDQKPLKVELVAREVLKLIRASLPATIEIRESTPAGLRAVVGDAGQIHQVIMNLCTNAGHAMREKGGILDVSLSNIDLDAAVADSYPDLRAGSYLKLSISDTGHGIPPQIRERIFEPYFTTKDKGEGTGLGLSVVHAIVKEHGGQVNVYSESGTGTTFNIFLPAVAAHQSTDVREPSETVPGGSEKVLLVDDEPQIVNLQKIGLEALGYDVTARISAIEALEAFTVNPGRFDLVISDMTMPHMTGDVLALEIKKIRPDVPVILCTGFSEKISQCRGRIPGIDRYLMKPVGRKDLARTIREVLDGTAQASR